MKFINKNELIITKTPLRVSLFGGGTDYPEHFLKHGGLTINFAIDKYNYIILKKSKELTNKKYLLSYSKKETTNLIKQIKHPSIRECLKYFKINKRLEIHHIADLQSKTGLGSSSSFTVGLIKALIKLKNQNISKKNLSEKAIIIEREMIRERVGWQDQIISSFGGVNITHYYKSKKFKVQPIKLNLHNIKKLEKSILLVYTGVQRFAHKVLKNQIKLTNNGVITQQLIDIENITKEVSINMSKDIINLNFIGQKLNEVWQLKKELSHNISNTHIDKIYEKGINAGAIGGKLLGAGMGGYILFIVKDNKRKKLEETFKNNFLNIKIDFHGSRYCNLYE